MPGGRQIRLSAAARSDLREIAKYYSSQAQELDARFIAYFVRVIDSIVERPFSFPISYRDVRRSILRIFPYGVFYRVIGNDIHIIAVMDLQRDPATIKERLR
jgi:plasmid stabilization system protein ParE